MDYTRLGSSGLKVSRIAGLHELLATRRGCRGPSTTAHRRCGHGKFATMQHAADLGGRTRFVSMQDQYSLLQREEEREMLGLLAPQGVGSIPWSPLAAGRVARPWGEQSTTRSESNPDVDMFGRPLFPPPDGAIVDAVAALDLELTEGEVVALEQPCTPRQPTHF
jgi:aryl-alcohol dehydrogenase-like predicted oxidoreductase